MTPAEGVKRAAQALSLLWPFAVIAAVSFGRMSLLLAVGLPLFAFQALFILRKGIRGASIPALLISIIGTAVCGLGLMPADTRRSGTGLPLCLHRLPTDGTSLL